MRRIPEIKPNLFDKIVQYVDPIKGMNRMRARMVMAIAGGYTGASRDRRAMSEWQTFTRDADSEIVPDLETLRTRSRDLARNAPLAAGAIHTKVSNIVGAGLTLQSRIDADFLGMTEAQADQWQRTVEREFKTWAESQECDAEGTLNFYGLQALAFRSCLESGDVFALLPMVARNKFPYEIKIQLIEADRVSNPTGERETPSFCAGIEKDSTGCPIAYHIQKDHPGSTPTPVKEWQRVTAWGPKTHRRNVLHLYAKTRPGQTRGVPDLAPVIETLKQMDRYTEAELMAAVVTGMFAVFVKTETGEGLAPVEPTSMTGGSRADKDFKITSGMIAELSPGESIETLDPNRPNIAFDPFMMAILRQVGVALELPFEVLIKHFTASYSASRAALLEAWRFFKNRRKWLAQVFCDPIYEAWLFEAVANGRIYAPGFLSGDPAIRKAYCGAEWIGPSMGQLDPLREAKGEALWLEMGVKTLSRVTAETTGEDWQITHNQRVREVTLRREAGLEEKPIDPTAVDNTPPN